MAQGSIAQKALPEDPASTGETTTIHNFSPKGYKCQLLAFQGTRHSSGTQTNPPIYITPIHIK